MREGGVAGVDTCRMVRVAAIWKRECRAQLVSSRGRRSSGGERKEEMSREALNEGRNVVVHSLRSSRDLEIHLRLLEAGSAASAGDFEVALGERAAGFLSASAVAGGSNAAGVPDGLEAHGHLPVLFDDLIRLALAHDRRRGDLRRSRSDARARTNERTKARIGGRGRRACSWV